MKRKTITIITPCFNEELNIADCYRAVKAVFDDELTGYDREHIFCDNASIDSSIDILRQIASIDASVKVVVNARNYGPFRNTFNGLFHATGDAVVVLLAADLQDPPSIIPEMVKQWEAGHEVVYGIRANRQEGWVMRSVRQIYYRLVSRFANIVIPDDVGEFQLIDKVVLDALKRHEDYYPYIRGMIANCGFRAVGVPYVWQARRKGFSKNRLYHLVDQALNGLISFTNLPMRICMFVGFMVAFLSLAFAMIAFVAHFISEGSVAPPGTATLIVAIFFFGGVQLLFLGVIGEYVSAIHSQVRKRPLVVERELINFSVTDYKS